MATHSQTRRGQRATVLWPILLVAILLSSATSVQAQFHHLVLHLPDGANTLVLFNVEKLKASPLGSKEGWQENHDKLFSAGFLMVPPQATRFVMAAQVDFETNRVSWDTAVADLEYEPNMVKVAEDHGGSVDQIGDNDAAVLPSDTYVVKFGKNMAGMMSPGNRQSVGRWVQSVYSSSNRQPLTSYLQEAEKYADHGTPIIMAMDLQHLLSPRQIRARLATFQSLKGHDVDLDQLSKVLSSVRGMTLGITVGQSVFGKLKIDFGEDVSMTKAYAKPLLLEALANHGAMINEFNEWKAEVAGTEISIEGYLQQSGRQRILSMLDAPPALHAPVAQAANDSKESQQQLAVLSSQHYFKSIEQLVNDLSEHRKSGKTSGQVALWFGKYARRVDGLPILHVDPKLVQFGAYVANQLRQAQSAMQGIGENQAVELANQPDAVVDDTSFRSGAAVGRFGGFGAGYSYRYREDPRASARLGFQQSAQIRTQQRVQGNVDANQIMEGIESNMAQVRDEMTEKYQVEF